MAPISMTWPPTLSLTPSPIQIAKESVTRLGGSSECRPMFSARPGSRKRDAARPLTPSELVQPLVIDPEMMGDLVQHRPSDLGPQLDLFQPEGEMRLAIDHDPVG